MANIQYYDVILKPVVTEKSMELMGDKKYTFLVHPEATKSHVSSFNDGKKKRVRGTFKFGKTAKTKKAIVKLTADSADIEIFEGL